ncbi:hypothetical protein TTHERM_000133719 (macronuclear) [Tetrahymena thermophila SB210]|uniref:Uncharacterized protein n=1 Tax=Tetrahymena thermophila (strain SB210) TaxID=312017 RepID=W7XAQ5_TETTS|nr:hypothetical protein TTHERM_000133719 [Tetrahymena thermophila SB210]EWS73498.1 hypothetical protein TTHERM_000133719 [Tetrahymena thermophila SB210]|eukprot:XP_012653980.1 hypothetical protein TTHERM_000133719 [Tetrahymena thermophila SB210]
MRCRFLQRINKLKNQQQNKQTNKQTNKQLITINKLQFSFNYLIRKHLQASIQPIQKHTHTYKFQQFIQKTTKKQYKYQNFTKEISQSYKLFKLIQWTYFLAQKINNHLNLLKINIFKQVVS